MHSSSKEGGGKNSSASLVVVVVVAPGAVGRSRGVYERDVNRERRGREKGNRYAGARQGRWGLNSSSCAILFYFIFLKLCCGCGWVYMDDFGGCCEK